VELVRPLEERFRLPVYIDNDVNTLTIAEQWFGHGHGVEHFLVVNDPRLKAVGLSLLR
jgi:predicted NBD/HSP70 family sugar kinase